MPETVFHSRKMSAAGDPGPSCCGWDCAACGALLPRSHASARGCAEHMAAIESEPHFQHLSFAVSIVHLVYNRHGAAARWVQRRLAARWSARLGRPDESDPLVRARRTTPLLQLGHTHQRPPTVRQPVAVGVRVKQGNGVAWVRAFRSCRRGSPVAQCVRSYRLDTVRQRMLCPQASKIEES